MQNLSNSRRLTITKSLEKDKFSAFLAGFGKAFKLAILLTATVTGNVLVAQEVHIGERLPLRGSWKYRLEVASDPNFSSLHLEQDVTSVPYVWTPPSAGVYHWRLARGGADGQEKNAAASGSFAALTPQGSPAPVRLTWGEASGADRYLIHLKPAGQAPRTISSSYPGVVLSDLSIPTIVEILPYRGQTPLSQPLYFDPSLRIIGLVSAEENTAANGTPEPSPATEMVEEQEVPLEPLPAPVVEDASDATVEEVVSEEEPVDEADDADPASDEPGIDHELEAAEVVASPSTFPVHSLWLDVSWTKEALRAQKLEINVDSELAIVGFAGGFATKPWSGLYLSAHGRYHEHRATVDYVLEDTTGTGATVEELNLSETLFTLAGVVGWDLMRSLAVTNQQLVIGISLQLLQFPRLPFAFAGGPDTVPSFQRQEANPSGLYLNYGYGFGDLSLVVDGGVVQQADPEVEAWQWGLRLSYLVVPHWAVRFGGGQSSLYYKGCAESAAECLQEGHVRTTIRDTVVDAGISFEFR